MPDTQCIHVDAIEVLPVTGPNVKLIVETGSARLPRCIERSAAIRAAYDILTAVGEAVEREKNVVVPILGERPREYTKLA
jgi:hypothetical protein